MTLKKEKIYNDRISNITTPKTRKSWMLSDEPTNLDYELKKYINTSNSSFRKNIKEE